MHSIKDIDNLKQLLADLKEGKFEAVEFGDPDQPAGWLSGIRIKYIDTMGGTQFRICSISRGMESGGIYHYNIEGAFEQASKMHERYTRPIENKLIRELLDKKPRPDLAWFGIEKMPLPIRNMPEIPPMGEGEVTITLGEKEQG